MEQQRRRPLQKLINRVGRIVRPRQRLGHLCHQPSTSLDTDFSSSLASMADAEEDFSSLPLSDRFTHKVFLVLFGHLFLTENGLPRLPHACATFNPLTKMKHSSGRSEKRLTKRLPSNSPFLLMNPTPAFDPF